MKENVAKKFVALGEICLYALGAIGGFGFSLAGDSWPCAVGVVALAVWSFPTLKKSFNKFRK